MEHFESTYKDNYQKMFQLAQKMLVEQDDIPDILQEIFVCYYEKLKSGSSIEFPRSWLMKATVNKSIDYLNHQKRHTSLDAVKDYKEDELVEKQQSESEIRNAISQLSEKEMKLVILYSEDFSYKEISEITGIKFSSVGKSLFRSLEKLKVILKKMNYEMY